MSIKFGAALKALLGQDDKPKEPAKSVFGDSITNLVEKPQPEEQEQEGVEPANYVESPDMPEHEITKEFIRDEGERLVPYKDTVGKWTVGIGFNLTDKSNQEAFKRIVGRDASEFFNTNERITQEQSRKLFEYSYNLASEDAESVFKPVWNKLNQKQRVALINFTFNLGKTKVRGFKKAVAAINNGDGKVGAEQMLDSKWRKQVKGRAYRLADVVRTINLNQPDEKMSNGSIYVNLGE